MFRPLKAREQPKSKWIQKNTEERKQESSEISHKIPYLREAAPHHSRQQGCCNQATDTNSCVTTKRDCKTDKKEGKHQKRNSSQHQKERNSPNSSENEEIEAQQTLRRTE